MTAHLIDVRAIAPQRWKNGAGFTRELAVHPPGAGMDDFDWRISVAEVTQDAPFSAFAGVERCIALLRGRGMQLHPGDGTAPHRLERCFEPFTFSGDLALRASLIDGPSTDLNVMCRRGRWRAAVSACRGATEISAADVLCVLCAQGNARVMRHDEDMRLHEMQALLWPSRGAPLGLRLDAPESVALVVRLTSLCQDGAR